MDEVTVCVVLAATLAAAVAATHDGRSAREPPSAVFTAPASPWDLVHDNPLYSGWYEQHRFPVAFMALVVAVYSFFSAWYLFLSCWVSAGGSVKQPKAETKLFPRGSNLGDAAAASKRLCQHTEAQ